MPEPRRQISPERQLAYYFGMVLSILGILLFLTNFFNHHGRDISPARGIGGMAFMVIGALIRNIGAKGLAGSGVILDPEQAREDEEPLSRMRGGMINDVISEIDVVNKLADRGGDNAPAREVIKVRCRACQALNDEDAQFCDQCGVRLA